ncbi:MAG: CHAT domain-containing protein [Candidatus Aminicenantales bacterium]
MAKAVSHGTLFLLFFFFPIFAAGFSATQKAPSPTNSINTTSAAFLYAEGENLRLEGDFEKAGSSFSRALTAARKEKNPKCELDALIALGFVCWNTGQLNESSDFFTDALTLAKQSGEKGKEANCSICLEIYRLYQEAKSLRSSGQNERAIELFNKAIALSKEIQSPDHELKCLRQLSLIYWSQSNLKEFFLLTNQAFNIAIKINNRTEEARCLNNLGLYYWKIDNYASALNSFEKSIQITTAKNNIEDEADSIHNIGIIWASLGNYEKAIETLTKAYKLDQSFMNTGTIAIDYNTIGTAYKRRGVLSENAADLEKALAYYSDSLKLAKEAKNDNLIILILNNIGSVKSQLKDYDEALKYFNLALKQAEESRDQNSLGMLLNNIGIVYSNKGNYEESTRYYEKAITLAVGINGGDILWEAYLEIANAFMNQSKYEEAIINYKNSIQIIEEIRFNLIQEELKASYLGTEKRIDAYQNLINVLATLYLSKNIANYGTEAFNYLEKAKARAFLDSLEVSAVNISQGADFKLINKEKETMREISMLYTKLLMPDLSIENKQRINDELRKCEEILESIKREIRTTSPAYANLKYPEVITYDEVQKDLADSETLFLAYSLGKDQSFGFAIRKGSMKVFRAPARKTIQQHVTDYRKAISDKDNQDFGMGRVLFDELVRPGLSEGIKKLIIIPDDILSLLPFETLVMDNPKERWLIQNYAIAYVPSLSSLRELDVRKRVKGTGSRKDLLAFGDPYYGVNEENTRLQSSDIFQDFYSSSAVNFYRLKYSGLEIQKIASLFKTSRAKIFQREEATEDRIKSEDLSDYRIVHLATHGLIDDKKPARSSVILALDRDPAEDGFLQMREIFNLRLNADMVVLSACQTGLGQFIRGEGIEGLSRAFFYAGASSVLMSLWAVNDEATYQLMERLYHHLRSSDPPITALRKAKLEMIDSEVLSHPYYWAGFIIHGKTSGVIFPSILNKPILLVSSILLGIMLVLAFRNLNKKRV